MAEMSTIYNEWLADITKKGCGGIVSHVIHDYKNGSPVMSDEQPPYETTYTDLKTKNERIPAVLFLLYGGDSLPIVEVIK